MISATMAGALAPIDETHEDERSTADGLRKLSNVDLAPDPLIKGAKRPIMGKD